MFQIACDKVNTSLVAKRKNPIFELQIKRNDHKSMMSVKKIESTVDGGTVPNSPIRGTSDLD